MDETPEGYHASEALRGIHGLLASHNNAQEGVIIIVSAALIVFVPLLTIWIKKSLTERQLVFFCLVTIAAGPTSYVLVSENLEDSQRFELTWIEVKKDIGRKGLFTHSGDIPLWGEAERDVNILSMYETVREPGRSLST